MQATRTRPLPLALLLALAAGACTAPRASLMPRYMDLDLDGDVAVSSTGVTASNDFSDVGLDDSEDALSFRADLSWLSPHLTLSTQDTGWSGSGTLSAAIDDGGIVIPAGTQVNSKLDLAYHSAIVTFDLVPTSTVEAGIGPGIALVDISGQIADASGLTTETVDFDELLPMPMIAARTEVQIDRFEIGVLLAGLGVEIDGDELAFVELDVHARYRLFGLTGDRVAGSIGIGWRHLDIAAEYDDDGDSVDVDIEVSGPYFGFLISF